MSLSRIKAMQQFLGDPQVKPLTIYKQEEPPVLYRTWLIDFERDLESRCAAQLAMQWLHQLGHKLVEEHFG